MLLSLDPSSRKTGVALFTLNGNLLGTWQLVTDETTWGMRLCEQACQFAELPIPHEEITEVAAEALKGASNSVTLNAISGIFWMFLPLVNLKPSSFIVPSSWKAFVRKKTGEKEPKGLVSLRAFGYAGPDVSDDEADAIMIGLCYLSKRK